MPKVKEPLTDKKIKSEIKKGANTIADGSVAGLALYKTKSGYVWRLRYTYGKKRSYYVIGEYPVVGLKEAREIAREAKLLLEKNIDPNEYKKKQQEELIRQQNKKRVIALIEEYLEIKKQNVSSDRFKKNYVGTFKNYVIPFIGNKFIDEVSKDEILNLVKKVPKIQLKKATRSANKTYKAKEVLNILKDMFEFAVDNGYLEYNPAYSIKLERILPKHTEKHMEAITDENELKKLYKTILNIDNPITSKILQFQALTLLRNKNLRNLKWDYIDWDKRVIVFPKESMKAAHSDFRLPLTDTLIEILEYFKQFNTNTEFVFISSKTNKQISENFLSYQYKKLGYQGRHNPHGWRSSFRTIAAEKYKEHKFPFEVIETQLHHKIGDKVTQAYLRTDFLEERRNLLKWWEEFLNRV
jgi:integrase